MIDLHCHILPGIDDGARDLEDSVAMALQGQADGIQTVCATPHIRHDHDVVVDELPERVSALNEELRRRRIAVRVEKGGEVAETAVSGLGTSELRTVSLCGTGRWLLVEPAPGPLSDSLADTVALLHQRGVRCVIAHPERHPGDDFAERLAELVRAGSLVQVTAALLEDPDTSPWLLELAGRGLVHLLGSDSHSASAGRPVAISGALARLGEVPLLRPHVDWIAREAPRAILSGDEVSPPYEPA